MRKDRSDSAASAQRATSNAGAMIEPPAHIELNDLGLIFWTEIIAMKPVADWTPHDLSIAGSLAQTMEMADAERKLLSEEGTVVKSLKGTPMANPRASILHGFDSRIKSIRQSLNIHGRAREGEARDAAKRNKQLRSVTADAEDVLNEDDGLLAN